MTYKVPSITHVLHVILSLQIKNRLHKKSLLDIKFMGLVDNEYGAIPQLSVPKLTI